MADGDPFDRFTELFSQFDSAGSAFDPTLFSRVGWPVTPLPVGQSGDAAMTPAAGTKRAVTQLYEALEAIESNPYSSDSMPEQLLHNMTPAEFGPVTPEKFGSFLAGTYQLWLTNFTTMLIESYAVRILHDELVVADHRGTASTYEWLLTLTQAEREQLLRRCTSLEDELIDELSAVRTERNELLYSLGEEEVSVSDPVTAGQRYLAVLGTLEERVTNGSGYDFLTGTTGASKETE